VNLDVSSMVVVVVRTFADETCKKELLGIMRRLSGRWSDKNAYSCTVRARLRVRTVGPNVHGNDRWPSCMQRIVMPIRTRACMLVASILHVPRGYRHHAVRGSHGDTGAGWKDRAHSMAQSVTPFIRYCLYRYVRSLLLYEYRHLIDR
jgi:hypothetical protein